MSEHHAHYADELARTDPERARMHALLAIEHRLGQLVELLTPDPDDDDPLVCPSCEGHDVRVITLHDLDGTTLATCNGCGYSGRIAEGHE